jgi:hypothetical protein
MHSKKRPNIGRMKDTLLLKKMTLTLWTSSRSSTMRLLLMSKRQRTSSRQLMLFTKSRKPQRRAEIVMRLLSKNLLCSKQDLQKDKLNSTLSRVLNKLQVLLLLLTCKKSKLSNSNYKMIQLTPTLHNSKQIWTLLRVRLKAWETLKRQPRML